MTEKRFTIVNMGLDGQYIKENGKIMTIERVVDLLNENEQLKSIIDKLTIDNTKMKKVLNTTKKKNEELKDENKALEDFVKINFSDMMAEKMKKELQRND